LDPVTLRPTDTVERAAELMRLHNISGVPITTDDDKLVGILTRRDMKFMDQSEGSRVQGLDGSRVQGFKESSESTLSAPRPLGPSAPRTLRVEEVMTKENLVTA